MAEHKASAEWPSNEQAEHKRTNSAASASVSSPSERNKLAQNDNEEKNSNVPSTEKTKTKSIVLVKPSMRSTSVSSRNDLHFANIFDNQNNQGRMVGGPVHGGHVFFGDNVTLNITGQAPSTSSPISSQLSAEERQQRLVTIQSSLRTMYLKSYRNIIPISSAPFFFDIEEKWVNLALQLDDSTVTEDYADLLKKAFVKADMLIIEGDPGLGKSTFMHRLAYEWTQEQSRLSDYDLVLHIEFRKLRESECKDIKELIVHYMKGYLDEEDYEIFHDFINDIKHCKENKILVLLDGYDESALEEQCEELSNFFSSSIGRPLWFNVLITSRKGYLSKLRNQGRFIFADIIGFTTTSQKQEYISKNFSAANDTALSENIVAVTHLLNTNENLKRLSDSPLMLTFVCLLHKKIIDGTEVELYMNIIWWMIDRYQKSNPDLDVPNLFEFKHNSRDKFCIIENSCRYFPQLHLLGMMGIQDIFKSTFTEAYLRKFKLKEIVQQVGFLRKEEIRDASYHIKTEFSFVHRTIQEFIMALTFFLSNKNPPKDFNWYVAMTATNKGYGIIPAKIQTFLHMIYSSKMKINETKITYYHNLMKISKILYSNSAREEHSCTSTINSQDDAINLSSNKERKNPQSSEEAIQLLHDKAGQDDAIAQIILGIMYEVGIITIQSDEEAVKWYTKSAEQGYAPAQFNLGCMYDTGRGVPQSDEEAVKWYREAAEQGNADAQHALGWMYKGGKGVPQSDEEAVKWFTQSAEQENARAQYNLGWMYVYGQGVPVSDEEAIKWFKRAAEQGSDGVQVRINIATPFRRTVVKYFFIWCRLCR